MTPTPTDALTTAKRSARADAKARISEILPADFQSIGRAMADRLTALPMWQRAPAVFCFVSMKTEPDTAPILRAALAGGKSLYVPQMLAQGQMALVRLERLSDLSPNRCGILEPGASAETVSPAGFQRQGGLAVLPCLAAGRDGSRLGRGGGYYDRFLAVFTGPSVLLCPDALLRPTLPTGPLDARPGHILTESNLLSFKNPV